MAECPNAAQHCEGPTGYLNWHAWAERKHRTHRQERCPGCGLWKLWRSRKTGRLARG